MRYTLAILVAAAVVEASPVPQAVTAAVAPTGAPPPGCTDSRPDSFGIAVIVLSSSSTAPMKRQASPVSQISSDQSQGPVSTASTTMMPVSQIDDGQIQASPTTMTMASPMPVISEAPLAGPVVVTTTTCISQSAESQNQASITTTTTSLISSIFTSEPQPEPSTPSISGSSSVTSSPEPSDTISSPPQEPNPETETDTVLVGCLTPSTLLLTLSNSTLTDSRNRTGYIASNHQFQFDGPPSQARSTPLASLFARMDIWRWGEYAVLAVSEWGVL